MYLLLLEVYLDPQVGASDVPSQHRGANEDSPRGNASHTDTASTSSAGTDVQVLPGGARRGTFTPRNRKPRNAQPHFETARASSQSSGSEEAASRNGPGLGTVSANREVMLDDALRLLTRFWDRIDGARAARLLPGAVEIARLVPFLGPLLRRISEGKRNAAVVKSLRRSENLQVRDRLLEEQRRSFRVTGGTVCTLCHKKIGTSVFAVHPDNRLVHFSCYKEAGAGL